MMQPSNKRRAFTLVELMVVLLILSALAALAVKVGKYLTQEASRQETKSRQAILMRGVQKYMELHNAPPESAMTLEEVPGYIDRPTEMTVDAEFLVYARSNQLVFALLESKDTEEYLRELPNAIKQGDMDNPGAVVDADGRYMDYHSSGGLGDSPVIISPGPDGYFDDEYAEDNIRSDGRVVK